MVYWIICLLINLLLPFTMIGFGKHFMVKPPAEINKYFGYRTALSMKNKDAWDFAHKYFGKIWYIAGFATLPIAVIPMLFVIGKDVNCIATVCLIVCVVMAIPLVGSIPLTEKALRKNFDKNGVRR